MKNKDLRGFLGVFVSAHLILFVFSGNSFANLIDEMSVFFEENGQYGEMGYSHPKKQFIFSVTPQRKAGYGETLDEAFKNHPFRENTVTGSKKLSETAMSESKSEIASNKTDPAAVLSKLFKIYDYRMRVVPMPKKDGKPEVRIQVTRPSSDTVFESEARPTFKKALRDLVANAEFKKDYDIQKALLSKSLHENTNPSEASVSAATCISGSETQPQETGVFASIGSSLTGISSWFSSYWYPETETKKLQ